MPIDFNTQGLNWRKTLRDNDIFVAMVTPAWLADRRCQQQLAYARELGKPIYLLVKEGSPLPRMREGEVAQAWKTTEELAELIARIADRREEG